MKNFVLFALLFFPFVSISQLIKGTVYEKLDNEPIIAVTIINLNNQNGVLSDFDGEFYIKAERGDTLEIKSIGYKTEQVIVDSNELVVFLEVGTTEIYTYDWFFISAERYLNPHSFEQIKVEDIPINQIQGQQYLYNNIPGLFMHAGALNTNRLTIRGIGSRSSFATTKIRAYVNDIPITTGIGESNLEEINLAFVDKINIYKGPTRPTLGSGLGGAIHYISEKRAGNSVHFSNRLSYGSFASVKNNAQFGFKHKKFSIDLNYDIMKSNGYRENNLYNRNIFTGLAVRHLPKAELSFFINATHLGAEIPSALNQTDFDNNPRKAAPNWSNINGNELNSRAYGGLSYKREITKNITSTNTLFAGKYINDERRPFNVLDQNSSNVGFRSNTEISYKAGNGRFNFGTEIYSEEEYWKTMETLDGGNGALLSDNEEVRRYVNLFVENKYNWGFIGLSTGLNVNLTNYILDDLFLSNGDQSSSYNYEPILSPFLSLDYRNSNNIYYLTISHGYSIPTLEETLTPEDLINQEIEPETGYNFELGIRREFKSWNLDASLYYMYVSNLLVPERISEDEYIAINAGKTAHPGLEISINRDFRVRGRYFIKPSLNYQFGPHKFIEFNNRDQDFSGSFLPGNPNHKMNMSILFYTRKWDFNWSNLYVSKMFANDSNTIEVPGYYLTNVSASYEILEKSNWTILLYGNINNLTNTKYASMLAVNPRSFGGNAPRFLYPGLPRNYYIGFEVKYRLHGIFK